MSGLMLGMFLAALDQTIVTTALTRISEDFHRLNLYNWVVTSYLLTSTVTTPLYGKISDLFGRKAIFQFAIVLFLAGSALSGLSGSMVQLILFRGVQGLGAGGLFSLALSIVGDVIPPRDRGRYQGYFGGVFGIASIVGPLAGGFLVDQASWRWVFYVNIPIGIVALFVINRVLHADSRRRAARIDVGGALLSVGGVALLLIAVQSAGQVAHLTTTAKWAGPLGLVMVAAFVWWESRAAEPIVPLRLFRNNAFSVASVLGLITGAVMFGAIIFLPLYLQTVRDISPTLSGLRLLPLLVGLLFTSISSGLLISKRGRYKIFVVGGTAVMTVGMYLMSLIEVNTNAGTGRDDVRRRRRAGPFHADPYNRRPKRYNHAGHGCRHVRHNVLPDPGRRHRGGCTGCGAPRPGRACRPGTSPSTARSWGRRTTSPPPWTAPFCGPSPSRWLLSCCLSF